jgi:Rieske Fe-S protein
MSGTTLMCQCHGSHVTSGAVLRGPATEPLTTYEVREKNSGLRIRICAGECCSLRLARECGFAS